MSPYFTISKMVESRWPTATAIVMAITVLNFSFAYSQVQSPATSSENEWLFIENGQIKVGVKRTSGAAIGWMSLSGSDKNLVNHYDRGRLIQQSYYGNEDGSRWDKQPWRWNPVQGGHYLGRGSPVVELKNEHQKIYAKSTPLHWATGAVLNDCAMEQTIELNNHIAHVSYAFTYSGTQEHNLREQEIPAIFLEPEFKNLVLYSADRPWSHGELERTQPGWPNEKRTISENWAAYVDDSGFGLGAYVPVAKDLTCYRFGDGNREHGACSYFAPLTRFAIKPGFVWRYDLYLTIGQQAEIRDRFEQLHSRTK